MAYRLKFVQAVFMAVGTGKEWNDAAARFGGITNTRYRGTVAFLRKEEMIDG